MSSYPPPTNWTQSIFNPQNWVSYNDALTIAMGNKKYLIKTGTDSDYGIANFTKQINLSDTGFRFISDSNTGIYLATTSDIRITTGSVDRLTLTSSLTTSSNNIKVPTGSAANCSVQSTSNAGTGLHFTSGNCSLANNGSTILSAGPTSLITNNTIRAPDLSASTPSYSFSNEITTGFYRVSSNIIGTSIGSVKMLETSSTGITFTNSGVSGASPTVLSYYETYTFATTWQFSASVQSASYNILITRVGNVCTAVIPSMTVALTNSTGFSNNLSTNQNLPTRFLPTGTGSYNASQVVVMELGGVRQYGFLTVIHNGGFVIWNALRTQWANGGVVRISDPLSISWIV